jgi:hypothetical protein
MVFLALNWRVWLILFLLFTYALGRRLVRDWHRRYAARRAAGPRS